MAAMDAGITNVKAAVEHRSSTRNVTTHSKWLDFTVSGAVTDEAVISHGIRIKLT